MCDVRGVWLVDPLTRDVVFSRRFRTVERRARSLAAAGAAAARPNNGVITTATTTESACSDGRTPALLPSAAGAAWRDLPPTDAEWIEAVLAELAAGGDTDADPVSARTAALFAADVPMWQAVASVACHMVADTVCAHNENSCRAAAHALRAPMSLSQQWPTIDHCSQTPMPPALGGLDLCPTTTLLRHHLCLSVGLRATSASHSPVASVISCSSTLNATGSTMRAVLTHAHTRADYDGVCAGVPASRRGRPCRRAA